MDVYLDDNKFKKKIFNTIKYKPEEKLAIAC